MPEPKELSRQQLRAHAIAARRALAPAEVAAMSAAVCRHLLACFPDAPGRTTGFCWPVHNEPDVRTALAAWCDLGAIGCLPVVVEEAAPLAFRPWMPGTPLIADRYGIPTPSAGEFVVPDALLLPLNAFDAAGYRLGYGGGYFDRTLAVLSPRPLVIGVGFELGRVDSIDPQPHDEPLDWIVTELGVFKPTSAADRR